MIRKSIHFFFFFIFLLGNIVVSKAQLNAQFTADTLKGCDALGGVKFTDQSTGGATTWNWDFGNGNVSTLENPVASYIKSGSYTVQLIVSDGGDFDTLVKTNYINIYKSPTANYKVDTLSGCPPLAVEFEDLSTPGDNPIQDWFWDYGDGSSPQNNPKHTHTYVVPGNFSSSLLVVDTAGCSSTKNGSSISVLAGPIANFTTLGPSKTCQAPLTVNFVNTTQNKAPNVTYLWEFGDGTTSTALNPTKVYSTKGFYNVKLSATNGFCSDFIEVKDFIQLTESVASFSFPKSISCLKDTVWFVNESVGAEEFVWNFGDGTVSLEEEPFHVFPDTGTYDIKLSISSNGSCRDDTIISIYIDRPFAKFTSAPNYMCELGDTVKYTDQSVNAASVSWRFSNGGGSNRKSGRNVSCVQGKNGEFHDSLIAVSQFGCRDTVIKSNNRIIDLPEIYLRPDTGSKCTPVVLNFSDSIVSSNAIVNRQWDFGNGNTSNLLFPPTQTYIQDGEYTIKLTITDSQGCVNSAKKNIEVGLHTNPTIAIDKDTACFQDTILLSETSGSPLIESWQWFSIRDTQILIVGGTKRQEVDRHRDTGNYDIRLITKNRQCADTTLVSPAYFIRTPKANPYFELDSCGYYDVSFFSNSTGANKFHWDFGDGGTSDSSNAKHNFAREGIYKIKYEFSDSLNHCAIIDSFKLRVSNIKTGLVAKDTIGCVPFQLNLIAADNLFVGYRWTIEEELLSKNRELNMTIDEPGIYNVMLEFATGFGCRDTLFQKIYVFKPEAEMKINLLNDCLPYEVEFTDETPYDTTFSNIRWEYGDGTIGRNQIDTARYTLVDSIFTVGMYIENEFGCKDTIIYEDTIITPNKVVDFVALDSALCVKETARFRNQSIGQEENYFWDFGDGGSSSQKDANRTYNNDGEFAVTLRMQDVSGCTLSVTKNNQVSVQAFPKVGFTADTLDAKCFPLPVNFTDTSNSPFITNWRWDFGDNGVGTVQNPFHNYNQPGEFDVQLIATTSHGCTDSLTKPAYIKTAGPIAEFTISKDTTCKFEDVIFEMVNAKDVAKFTWDFGDGNDGGGSPVAHKYRTTGTIRPVLILEDLSGSCFNIIEGEIFVEDVIASFTADDTIGCEPHTINLTNTSQRADIWAWNFGDGGGSVDYNTTYTFQSEGVYNIRMNIRNQNGCVDTAYQEVIVSRTPVAKVSADTTICEGDTIDLLAQGADVYVWTPATALSNPNNDLTKAYPTTNISYDVFISTIAGCTDSNSVSIEVQPKPEMYSLKDTALIIGEDVEFDVYSGPSFSYQWSPDTALNCTDCPNPRAMPLESTLYFVNISDPFSCFNSKDSVLVSIKIAFSLDFPKAFTPNGDGSNDKIYVRGWGLKELLELKIYNRWGEIVYESNDLNEGWDGTFRGQPQNVETYIYTIRVLTFEDEILSKKGNFSLMR